VAHDPWPKTTGKLTALDQSRLVLIEWFTAIDPAIAARGGRPAAAVAP
jgi:hypothetical protein